MGRTCASSTLYRTGIVKMQRLLYFFNFVEVANFKGLHVLVHCVKFLIISVL